MMEFISSKKFSITLLTFLILELGSLSESLFLFPRLFPESLSLHPAFHGFDPTSDRIIGGEYANDCTIPWQVSLQRIIGNKSSHYCGATHISSNCIITAAHCIYQRRAKDIVAYGGTTIINAKSQKGSKHLISEIIAHEDYDPKTVANDIAILKLVEPTVFSGDCENAIPIPDKYEEIQPNSTCSVSGWGTTEEGGRPSSRLKYVNVTCISDGDCRDKYGYDEIKDSMLCAGELNGLKDSCQGDSGGPLISNQKIVGIVSWGYGCARPNYPGVYTQVSYFVDWIEKNNCF